jgi:hypothetical protein
MTAPYRHGQKAELTPLSTTPPPSTRSAATAPQRRGARNVLAMVRRHGRSSPHAPLPRRHGRSSPRAAPPRCRLRPWKAELASRHGYAGIGLGCSPHAKCSMKCL